MSAAQLHLVSRFRRVTSPSCNPSSSINTSASAGDLKWICHSLKASPVSSHTSGLDQMLAAPRLHDLARGVGVAQEVHVRLGDLVRGRGLPGGKVARQSLEPGLALRDARERGVPELRADEAGLDGVDTDRREV